MKCTNCGAEVRSNDNFCQYCGAELAKVAPKAEIHYHQHYDVPKNEPVRVVERVVERVIERPAQNEPVRPVMPVKSSKNRLVLLLLCLFLGYLGAHRFYQGRIGLGIVYLLTFGLFGVGMLFDLIMIVLVTPRDTHGLPIEWL